MKTTTLYHCDRCEFTGEKAADFSAIKLPASMATSGNSDVHLCPRCRGELTDWLGRQTAAVDVPTVSRRPLYAIVDQEWRIYARAYSYRDADRIRDKAQSENPGRELAVFNLSHDRNAKLRDYLDGREYQDARDYLDKKADASA